MTRPPDLKDIDEQIEKLNHEKEAAVAEQDFEKAAALRDQADKLKKKKDLVTREWREKSKETDGVVDEEVIREVVSKMTGVPLKSLNSDETARLLRMEDELHGAVVSQDEAIKAIARAVARAGPASRTPNGRSAASSSPARRALVRRCWRNAWLISCSATKTPWCSST